MKVVAEFKKFITRGNVVDLAVGMIIGAAFTSIVKALADGIFKPYINYIIFKVTGSQGLKETYIFLTKNLLEDGSVDLANSIYIDIGTFLIAIINFLLTALVLFLIVKAFNKFNDHKEILLNDVKRAEFKKEKGIKLNKKDLKALKEAEEERIKEEQKKKEEENKVDPYLEVLTQIKTILETKEN